MPAFTDLPKLPPIKFGGRQQYPLFTRISIETSKKCTRSCWFCPSGNREGAQQVMSQNLYDKIVQELSELKFAGVVQWFLLNEPLMDKAYLERIRQLRQACPKVTIHVTTNWDTMHRRPEPEQVVTIHRLFEAGVNSLNLNDYDKRGYAKIVKMAADALPDPPHITLSKHHNWTRLGPRKRVLSATFGSDQLHTWAGAIGDTSDIASEGAQAQTGKGRCARPHRHIVVAYDGTVPICCAVDTTQAEVVGDVNENTLVEIWNSKRFFQYRHSLQQGIRDKDCSGCNATVAYSHVVRRVKM